MNSKFFLNIKDLFKLFSLNLKLLWNEELFIFDKNNLVLNVLCSFGFLSHSLYKTNEVGFLSISNAG